jgi:hypothetical protein
VPAAFAADSALDPAFSGYSSPYGRPVQAIGRGTQGEDDDPERAAAAADAEDDDGSGFFLYPAVDLGVTWDDNVYRTNTNPESATIYRLRPELVVAGGKGNTRFNAGYSGDYAEYSGTTLEELDSYDDHQLYAGLSGYGRKSYYDIVGDYKRGHDSPGGNDIGDNIDRYDEWDRYTLLGTYGYGSAGARLNLRLDGLLQQKRQDVLQAIDFDTGAIAAMLKIRIASKTQAVLEGGYRRYDYINSNQDADRLYGRIGLAWEATAKTNALVTYGYEDYRPDNPGEEIVSDKEGPTFGIIEEYDGSTWQANVNWDVRRRDTLSFSTSRGSRLSNGTGSSRVSTRYLLAWTHDWSERLRSNLGYMIGDDEYKGVDRDDDLTEWYLGASYKFRRNMLLRGDYRFEERDSTAVLQDYDRNRVDLMFEWEL